MTTMIEPKEYILKDGREVIIRAAEETDAENFTHQVTSVLKEAQYTVSTYPEDKDDFTVDKERQWIRKYIESDGSLLIAAEIEGCIIGSADLHSGERKRIQHIAVFGITVLKEFRDLGVGRALIETLIEWASKHPVIEKIGLAVFSNNDRAINLYKKLGFVEEGRKIKEIKVGPDNYADSILMYKFVK